MPYTANAPARRESNEQLRARIPGWGVDLDPADRPSVPRERFDPGASGAHWDFPERQEEIQPRERSIEHRFLTPVFGTSAPLRGLSGLVRRHAYAKYSEGRAAHWLILIAADRIDTVESRVLSLFSGRPDNIISETGVAAEFSHGGFSSRFGRGRADTKHAWIDPLLVAGPLIFAGVVAVSIGRRVLRR